MSYESGEFAQKSFTARVPANQKTADSAHLIRFRLIIKRLSKHLLPENSRYLPFVYCGSTGVCFSIYPKFVE
jgi:hypothetical protein